MALTRSAAVLLGSVAAAAVAVVAAAHWATPELTPGRLVGELTNSLTLTAGPISFRDPFDWLPAGLDVLWASAALTMGWLLFRPLASHARREDTTRVARELVRRHGDDTLSFFQLRDDKQHFIDTTRSAFVAYRIENGVLLVSGDPVGPREALPGLLRELCAFAEMRGLPLGVVGASEQFAELAVGAGLKSFYIGDEAIVELSSFSLEGRAIRKVRQSVTRSRKAGLDRDRARAGRSERGGAVRARGGVGALARQRAGARLLDGDRHAARRPPGGERRGGGARTGRRGLRLPALRALLRARRDVARPDAPRPRQRERPDGVPDRAARSSCWASAA